MQRLALLTLAVGSLLVACSRGGDGGQSTAATARPAATTPATSGIARPPQTPSATPGPLTRDRAEAVVRRIGLTDADLPPGMKAAAPVDKDTVPNGPLFERLQEFESGDARVRVTLDVLSFTNVARAQTIVSSARITHQTNMPAEIARRGTIISMDTSNIPLSAESSRITRGEYQTDRGNEALWMASMQQGSVALRLEVSGPTAIADAVASDLLVRLDQRMRAALADP